MVKTYEIDLDDALVDSASGIFETLGTDIDAAIKLFLTQAVLRKGFPFDVVIPDEEAERTEEPASFATEPAVTHDGITEDEENALATVDSTPVPSISPEIAARVAANEALVAQMRNEIGDKDVTPEFDEGEEAELEGKIPSQVSEAPLETENVPEPSEAPAETEKTSEPSEVPVAAEPAPESDDEDEDETTPDNLFDAWDVGEEEDIGCR